MALIAENLERAHEQIAQAAAKVGRAIDEIELVAISKTHDAAKVREAIERGDSLGTIRDSWAGPLVEFIDLREQFLLY